MFVTECCATAHVCHQYFMEDSDVDSTWLLEPSFVLAEQ